MFRRFAVSPSDICRAGASFVADRSGGIAPLYALSVFMLLGSAGLAIDFARTVNAKEALQTAIDNSLLNAASIKARGGEPESAFTAHLSENWSAKNPDLIANVTFQEVGEDALKATATLYVKSMIIQALGSSFNGLTVSVDSEVKVGLGDIQIALVLDTTFSMNGSKLSSLQTAARELVSSVYAHPKADEHVKIGIVPFAQYVNVGVGYRNEPWMSVAPNSTSEQQYCRWEIPVAQQTNCRTMTGTWMNDGRTETYTYTVCDGPTQWICSPYTQVDQWNGCVGSRAHPADTTALVSADNRVPGIMNVTCGNPLQRLTATRSDIENAIDAMVAQGETYLPSGLVWGLRVLSPGLPFGDAQTDKRRIMILMTDGENTKSPNYPNHDGSDAAVANTITTELCTNIKASGIKLYTIAFDVTSDPIKDLLRACASGPPLFFDASNGTELIAAFNEIGENLANVYLKK